MNEAEKVALEREKADVGMAILVIFVFAFISTIIYFLSKDSLVPLVIGVIAFFMAISVLNFIYVIYRIIILTRTIMTIANGDEIVCDFVTSKGKTSLFASKSDVRLGNKMYSVKVLYYNRHNEEKIFSTRPIYGMYEVKKMEELKGVTAKRRGKHIVITQDFDTIKGKA